ncbi:hypothetical protein M2366_001125 [Aeromonas sp. BIGb0405]|jgi:hypothetical protein|uniref:DUF1338 domain-containing protein n=1 Tax=unclassified Aeromonas TaxID=257493 RepID=UPI0021676376|nr:MULTISPECIES: DUF1338 domain-containing protein [unclassified Aeromonas]MCS3455058.1 hypothetical protein [Aeromonas sp. BIGb0405]MCS3458036.1 hypothetical protein [Aeromonas sp. BIGb0445]
MQKDIETLFGHLWDNYIQVTPSALKVHQLLGGGAPIVNDHVAFRTFNLPQVGLETLAAHFRALGYEERDEYVFKAKKLYAKHFEHADPDAPKVFISELKVEELSEGAQAIIHKLVAQVPTHLTDTSAFLHAGAPWQVSGADYQTLLAESEYAAWMAAWGYRANHFTVSINRLAEFDTIEAVNETLKAAGFVLNTAGGEVKGDPQVMLEQSSTMADKACVPFSDGVQQIPSCFYEFALRYPRVDGTLYPGFVEASADKIFESTNSM